MRIKQSACYPIFKPSGMTHDELFGLCREIGFAAVEMWARGPDFEEVVAAAKKHKLVVASMIGHNSLPDGLNKRSNHDRIGVVITRGRSHQAAIDAAERAVAELKITIEG